MKDIKQKLFTNRAGGVVPLSNGCIIPVNRFKVYFGFRRSAFIMRD